MRRDHFIVMLNIGLPQKCQVGHLSLLSYMEELSLCGNRKKVNDSKKKKVEKKRKRTGQGESIMFKGS